jgi:hypothetical protein
MNKTEKILALDKVNPDITNREIADMVGCSPRLVRAVLASMEEYHWPKHGQEGSVNAIVVSEVAVQFQHHGADSDH